MTPRVIIVEDDVLIGIDLAEQLIEEGFDAVGPFVTVADAVAGYRANGCDVAVLDINLGKVTSEEFAAELEKSGTPFVVLSGYSQDQHPTVFQGKPAVSKPVHVPNLVRALNDLLQNRD